MDGKNGAFQKRLSHNSAPVSRKQPVFNMADERHSIAGATGAACVLNRKNGQAEPGDESASLDHRFHPLVWTQSFLSVFGQRKTEVFKNGSLVVINMDSQSAFCGCLTTEYVFLCFFFN